MSVLSQFIPSGRTATELAEDTERAIREGELAPGQRIPAIRDVAAMRDVSPTTVAAAYGSLRDRGLIETHPRGSHVAHRPPLRVPAAPPPPEGVVDLSDGNPDPKLLPSLDAHLVGLLEDRPPVLYGQPADLEELMEVARARVGADAIPTEHLTIVGGALDGIERTLVARLRPGDRIAVEDPTFDAILDLLRALRLEPVPVAVDDYGPQPEALVEALDNRVTALLITPRAQNPTGAAISAERAAQLREVLSTAPELLVIEDDHAAGVAGARHHSLCHDGRDRWAVIRSTGKALAPDLRVAIMAGDATTVSRVAGRRAVGTGWVSTILQRLLVALWTDPTTPNHLDAAARTYRRRRRALLDEIHRHGLAAHGRSGWNVWIPVDDETATVQHLRDAGWAVRAGHRFRLRAGPAIRVTTAQLEPDLAADFASDLASGVAGSRPSRGA